MRTLLGLAAIIGAFWFADRCFAKCPEDLSTNPTVLPSQFTRNPGLRDLFNHATTKAPVFGVGVSEPAPVAIVSNPVSAPKRIIRLGTGPTTPNQPSYLY